MESGTAMTIAPRVTSTVSTIRTKMPYSGGEPVGYHELPVRNGTTPTCWKMGILSRRRNNRIKTIARMAERAVRNQTVLIAFSFRSRHFAVVWVWGNLPVLGERGSCPVPVFRSMSKEELLGDLTSLFT
jgi:hypothetical protein